MDIHNTHNIHSLRERRRELRKNQTETEDKLWFELRNSKLGVKFKRQYKLIVELDGEIHNKKENQEYDAIRDKYFKELDYRVLRFQNNEVETDLEKVLEKIESYFS